MKISKILTLIFLLSSSLQALAFLLTNERTLIHVVSAAEEDLEEVRRLVDVEGADIYTNDAHGRSMLQLATARGHVNIVRFLTERMLGRPAQSYMIQNRSYAGESDIIQHRSSELYMMQGRSYAGMRFGIRPFPLERPNSVSSGISVNINAERPLPPPALHPVVLLIILIHEDS